MSQVGAFGPQIRARRKALGWTAAEAAQRLGVSRSRLAEIERGTSYNTTHPTRPSRELVVKIAAVYDLPADLLLMAAGYPTEKPLDLSPASRDVLFLFERLSPAGQSVALGMLRLLAEGPEPYRTQPDSSDT